MNGDRIRKAIGLAIEIIGCAVSARFMIMALTAVGNTSDFTVIWAAGRTDPAMVYDHFVVTAAQQQITGLTGNHLRPFVYPPSSMLLFQPIALLSFDVAYPLWVALLALAFALAARQSFGWPAVLVSMITPPLVYGLWGGQPSILAAAIILACVPHLTDRPVMAGALMGIGAAIKPQCFVLVPLALLASRNWRAGFGFTVGATLPASVSAALWPQMWAEWIVAIRGFPAVVSDLGLDGSGVSPAAIAPAVGLPIEIG